jgi:hypothetical protein
MVVRAPGKANGVRRQLPFGAPLAFSEATPKATVIPALVHDTRSASRHAGAHAWIVQPCGQRRAVSLLARPVHR